MLLPPRINKEVDKIFKKYDFVYKIATKSSIFSGNWEIRIFYIKDRQLNYVTCAISWLDGNKYMLRYILDKTIDKIKYSLRKDQEK